MAWPESDLLVAAPRFEVRYDAIFGAYSLSRRRMKSRPVSCTRLASAKDGMKKAISVIGPLGMREARFACSACGYDALVRIVESDQFNGCVTHSVQWVRRPCAPGRGYAVTGDSSGARVDHPSRDGSRHPLFARIAPAAGVASRRSVRHGRPVDRAGHLMHVQGVRVCRVQAAESVTACVGVLSIRWACAYCAVWCSCRHIPAFDSGGVRAAPDLGGPLFSSAWTGTRRGPRARSNDVPGSHRCPAPSRGRSRHPGIAPAGLRGVLDSA